MTYNCNISAVGGSESQKRHGKKGTALSTKTSEGIRNGIRSPCTWAGIQTNFLYRKGQCTLSDIIVQKGQTEDYGPKAKSYLDRFYELFGVSALF